MRPPREVMVMRGIRLPATGSQAFMQMGDPFLGGFFRAIGRGLGRLLPIAGAALGLQVPSIPRSPMGHGQAGIPTLPRIDVGGGSITIGPGPGFSTSPSQGMPMGARRRRRLNPLNPRALRRSLRRIEGFRKFARRAGFVPRGARVARKLPFLRRRKAA